MTTIVSEFPFEEIRDPNGDFFHTIESCRELGYEDTQIWSVIEGDECWVYGPPHHYINRLGFVCTKEHHDNDTYYEEAALVERAASL